MHDVVPASGPAPRVSLGLPVYNGEAFLDACIASILAQDYDDFELIICDNASTDDTARIVAGWAARDPRIRPYRSAQNCGAALNFNRAFAPARGELFKWCAADDLVAPGFLGACVAALDAAPAAVLAWSGAVDIDEEGREIGEIYDNREPFAFGAADVAARFRDLVCPGHSCIAVFGLIRSAVLRETSLIAPYVASDKVLLAELGVRGPFVRVDGNLIQHRQHRGRSVTANPRLRDRAPWFDPRSGWLLFPHFRLAREYARVALAAPAGQRIRCLAHVARWIRWDGWRGMAEDLSWYLPGLR